VLWLWTNTASETIKNTQITKVLDKTESRSPSRVFPDERANNSSKKKIEHTTRNWRKLSEIPPRLITTTVNIATKQRPTHMATMLPTTPSHFDTRNGKVKDGLLIINSQFQINLEERAGTR